MTAPAPAPAAAPAEPATGGNGADANAAPPQPQPPVADGLPDLAAVTGAWAALLAELPIPVRSKWRGGAWGTATAERLRFEVPNEWHKKACDEGRLDVEKVLKGHFGLHVPVEVVVGGEGAAVPPRPGGSSPAGGSPASGAGSGPGAGVGAPADDDDEIDAIDVSELADASDVAVGGVDLLMREFGGELIQEDP